MQEKKNVSNQPTDNVKTEREGKSPKAQVKPSLEENRRPSPDDEIDDYFSLQDDDDDDLEIENPNLIVRH